MADEKFNIEVAVNAQLESLNKVQDALGELNNKIGIVSDSTSNLSRVWSGAMYNIGTKLSDLALKFPSFATSAIEAFGQQEASVMKLAAAIRSQGGNVSEVLPIMQQFAAEMQSITTYGDEQVLAMQSVATAMGVSADQMNLCIQGAIGLTNVYGIGLNEAIRASASVVQGKTEKLNELIPALSKCQSETQRYALAEKAMRDGFALAEAAANSLDGKLMQAANAWGDLQEVVGGTFAPTVKSVAGLIKGICELLTKNATVTKVLTTALASCAVGFAFTKVGGLLNVSKMFLGVMTSTKAATTAMHGLNLAIKANPMGMIASLATGAILGLSQLIDYVSNLESAEEKEADAQKVSAEARRKAASDALAASAVLDEYASALRRENETVADTASRISVLSSEIEKLSDRSKWSDNEQEMAAKKLVEKKKELLAIQKEYLDKVKATADAEYQYASNRETERKYRVERELNAARETGITRIIEFKEAELQHVEELQRSVELQKKYYADHAHLVKSEEDRKRIMEDAEAYAETFLKNMREENRQAEQMASTQKWLATEVENNKAVQRALETDILRARASGNEVLAKEIEGNLRVSQLASEIFEETRKESMSRKELESLMETSRTQAQQRYNLEKAITDEAQRQNLAKDAQAKIEDIILTNKIEQLKAQGKMNEARALEEERQIKSTLAGLQGVSDEDKKKLGDMMRQTNDFKAKQNGSQALGGSGSASIGMSSDDRRPSSVSAKYADAYSQFRQARRSGAIGANVGWTDFRDGKVGGEASKERRQVQARGFLGNAEDTARRMAGAVPKGVADSVSGIMTEQTQRKNQTAHAAQPPATADVALGRELSMRATDGGNSGTTQNSTANIEKMTKALDDCLQSLKAIKNNTAAMATQKKDN